MFDMNALWWELPVRVAVIYAALLILVRLSGKRTIGQFTPFDLLVVLLLSESVSSGLSGGEESVTGALLAAGTLVLLNFLVAVITARSQAMQQLLEGSPVLVGRDGELFTAVLKKSHVPARDVERALREADCDMRDMKCAFLEADGSLSILKDSKGNMARGSDCG